MPEFGLFAGLQDPDCALLEAGGVAYLMVAYAADVTDLEETGPRQVIGGTKVVAKIYAIQEQGQRVLLADSIVYEAAADHLVESVRCVHVEDRYLVVYFLERDTVAEDYTLLSRFVDTQAFDSAISWQTMSDIVPDDPGLYDVKQVYNVPGTSEYMLAWTTTTTNTIVRRVQGPDHTIEVAWSTNFATNHADRILGVHGDAAASSGGVAVAYQAGKSFFLVVHGLNYSDGAVNGTVSAHTDSSAAYTAVTMARCNPAGNPGSSRVAVVAEYEDTDIDTVLGLNIPGDHFAHAIVCREVRITSTPGTVGNAHVTNNLNLMSKAYSYWDAEGDLHVYCGIAYNTVEFDNVYRQMHGFIADMGLQHWGASANTIRPRPVCSYPNLNVDGRHHGDAPEASAAAPNSETAGKRTNHLSNWVPGPSHLCDLRKARAVVWPMFAAQGTEAVGNNPPVERAVPLNASAEVIWHVLEDPWTANRDPLDHPQPTVNFHGDNPLTLHSNIEVQDELMIAGGTPHLYDGQHIVELGFPWVPEIVDVAEDATGSITAGTRRYTAVFEWTDAAGQLHRSGHGNLVELTMAAPPGSALIRVRTLTIGNREASWLYPGAPPITIALYRTTDGSPKIFRRLNRAHNLSGTTILVEPPNDPTQWAIEIADNVTDGGLRECPPLSYVDGGNPAFFLELPPFTPPAAHVVANWQNRAWLAASERKELWYSKENLPTPATGRIAPEFHPFQRYLLDVVEGDVTGLYPLNDDLVIFTREGIYSLSGIGPDALGNGAQYVLQVLHQGTGCIEPRSIVEIPQGILFQSYKGIYLLDRGKALDFISAGAPVEDLVRASGNLRGGAYLPDRHTVSFVGNGDVVDEPLVLKWDLYHRMWSTAPIEPPNANLWHSSTAGGTAWRGNERDASHVVLCQGNLLIERSKDDPTPYVEEDDVGSQVAVPVDIELGWVHFAGLAGEMRVWELGITLGEFASGGRYEAEIDTDRDGNYSTASPVPYRWGGVFATTAGYLPIRPAVQRMTAFRLRFREPTTSPIQADNLTISAFSAKIGVEQGMRRVNPSTRGQTP